VLELPGEEAVLARDHRRGRQPDRDLVGDVRAREDGDAAPAHAGGEALTGRRVEALREAQHRRLAGEAHDDVRERTARDRDDRDIDVARRVVERHGTRGTQVDAGEVTRVASGVRDRARLLRRVAREHDVVLALEQDVRERRPPRAGPCDQEPHVRLTKSIDTGTPSSSKRSRSSFSTQ